MCVAESHPVVGTLSMLIVSLRVGVWSMGRHGMELRGELSGFAAWSGLLIWWCDLGGSIDALGLGLGRQVWRCPGCSGPRVHFVVRAAAKKS